MTASARRRIRIICLCLAGFAGSVTTVSGQTQWAPSRSTTRPSAAAGVDAGSDFVPDWQRTPGRAMSDSAVVRTSATTAFRESPAATASRSANSSRFTASGNANTAQLSHEIQLGPGEKLVGQPRYAEARSAVRTAAHVDGKGEVLPTPDGVSNNGRVNSGEIIHDDGHVDGDVQFDPDFNYENYNGAPGHCNSCGTGSCGGHNHRDDWAEPTSCPDCGMYGYHFPGCNRAAMCLENCYGFIFRESSIFGGVQSFKGPPDRGQNGNYGFNEGFNLVAPIIPFPRYGVGWQVGARWTQSNLSGNSFGSSSRDQKFITTALYHRAYRNCGLQWGAAFDWLDDNYYTNSSVAQTRYELSWLNGRGSEIGLWGTASVKNDTVTFNGVTNQLRPVNQYNLFYRYTSDFGSQARFWGGITNTNLAIAGADFRVPMSNRLDLIGGFNYIVPHNGNTNMGFTQESWNLEMNMVWYFGRRRDGIHNTPFRPLFNVADNGTMMFQSF